MIDLNTLRLGYDTTSELDAFGKPRLRSESELVKNTLLFILFTKPGQYPSLPNIGLDIQNMLFSFFDDFSESDLKDRIISQCSILGIYFKNGMINIRKIKYRGKPSMMIHIETSTELGESSIIGSTQISDSRFQIGITFDELDHMIYSIS